MNAVFVFIGGGVGSLVRYAISYVVGSCFTSVFPIATLLSNLVSSVTLALVMLLITTKYNGVTWIQPLVLVGFCGGFSTFSTFSAETVELIQSGHPYIAVINVVVSVTVGIGMVYYILQIPK